MVTVALLTVQMKLRLAKQAWEEEMLMAGIGKRPRPFPSLGGRASSGFPELLAARLSPHFVGLVSLSSRETAGIFPNQTPFYSDEGNTEHLSLALARRWPSWRGGLGLQPLNLTFWKPGAMWAGVRQDKRKPQYSRAQHPHTELRAGFLRALAGALCSLVLLYLKP